MPAWQTSTRRDRLPSDWARIRKRVLRRDEYRCTFVLDDSTRCGAYATEVDHIRAGDDHNERNLRAICTPHHRAKSSGEGGAAWAARRKEIHQKFRRSEDSFPTL